MKTTLTLKGIGLKRLHFIRKLSIYFIISLLLLRVIFYLFEKGTNVFINTTRCIENTNQILLQNQKILAEAQDLENNTRGYLISGDDEYLKKLEVSTKDLPKAVDVLRSMSPIDPPEGRTLDSLSKMVEKNILLRLSLINIRKQRGFEAAQQLFITGGGKRMMDTMRQIIDKVDRQQQELLSTRKAGNQEILTFSSAILSVLQCIILIMLYACFAIIYRNIKERERAEEALRFSNYFIAGIIDHSINPIAIRDTKGKYITVNEPFLKLVNKREEDVIGKTTAQLFTLRIAREVLNNDSHIIHQRMKITKEYSSSIGFTHYHFSASFFPLFNHDDVVYAVGTILTDITLLKEAQHAIAKKHDELQKLLNSLQELLDTSLDVICVLDEEGRFSEINAACHKLLGYTSTELIGKRYMDLVHAEDKSQTRNTARLVKSGVKVKDFENRCLRQDGSVINITWAAVWSQQEGLMYCIARDATEKKLALEQLKKSEESLLNAQKIAMLASWELDLISSTFNYSNQFYSIVQRSANEIGHDVENFLRVTHPDDIDLLRQVFYNALYSQSSWDMEYRITRPSGEVIYVHSRGEVVSENDVPVILKGTIQDISRRKKLEEEREMVMQELVRSNADLKQFSFITSHNFRAPLSNIVGILQLVDYDQLDEYNSSMLEMLHVSTRQLNTTIEDLTSIILIKDNAGAALEVVNFKEIFRRVEKVFKDALVAAGGFIHTDFAAPVVRFNPAYVESIFINLVSNAINYRSTERGLRISVCSYQNQRGEVILTIEDNGIGINLMRHRSKLFGLYQRCHDGRPGKGLGLYIIKSQITALDGDIDVESEENKGTRFIITFRHQVLPTMKVKSDGCLSSLAPNDQHVA